MTVQEVLQELIQRLGSANDAVLAWEQVREWPTGAIEIFQTAGWIVPGAPASMVECSGCEQNCYMPVRVVPARNQQAARALIVCDRRDDMGQVKIAMSRLRQWQITDAQVAQWISGALGLKGKPQRDKASGVFALGHLQGKRQLGLVQLDVAGSVALKVSGHLRPLIELVDVEGEHPTIDRAAILEMVDLPPPSEPAVRYQPSTTQREVRRLETRARYESWQKAYRSLKKTRPNMSDVWYSQQIAKMDVAGRRDAGTIKKHMKS
jgi:hypothetical protein